MGRPECRAHCRVWGVGPDPRRVSPAGAGGESGSVGDCGLGGAVDRCRLWSPALVGEFCHLVACGSGVLCPKPATYMCFGLTPAVWLAVY